MKSRYPSLKDVFQNCFDRGCSPEQLLDFLERCQRQHLDNPQMLQIIDELEVNYFVPEEFEGADTA